MKIKCSSLKYFFISCIFVFSDILGGGNLNLIYFLGIVLMVLSIQDKGYFRRLLVLWCPLLILVVMSNFFSGIQQSSIKTIVYLVKLLLCITLMYYIEKNFKKIDFPIIYGYTINLIIILLSVSMIFHNSDILWRLNDIYNDYSKTRLQLLFSEPSVLGQFVGIMIVFGVFTFINTSVRMPEKIKFMLLILTMVLSFAMSGIVYTIISCSILILISCGKELFNGKIKKNIAVFLLICILLFLYILMSDNVISQRLLAIIAGTDGSFNFRWGVAYSSLGGILKRTNYFGIGMGNMNTTLGEGILMTEKVDHFFANSYMYFIAENGIPGLIYILYLIIIILSTMRKNRLQKDIFSLKISLFVFVIISQIAGEYFTDPFIWCIYGMICANVELKENVIVFKGSSLKAKK